MSTVQWREFTDNETVTSVLIDLAYRDVRHDYFSNYEVVEFVKGLGRMFYIVNPAETTFQHPQEVPKFFRNVSMLINNE